LNDSASSVPYMVRPEPQARSVEMWSARRLPFESDGWHLGMRAALCAALHQLRAGPDEVLHACYVSEDATPCDVENVLLYNLGSGCFAGVDRMGIRLERSFACPTPPTSGEVALPHYQRYSVEPASGVFVHWRTGTLRARWTNLDIGRLTSATKPSAVWRAIRTGSLDDLQLPPAPPSYFGMQLVLTVPDGVRVHAAPLLKPLIDGVVCAFHAHDGSDMGSIGQRLAIQLGVEAPNIIALLQSSERAVLGRRRLLWPWREGLQWAPADDRCLAAEVLLRTHADPRWLCSGVLFEILPFSASRANDGEQSAQPTRIQQRGRWPWRRFR
jgi:hypothetical protein